jgi:DNA-binding NtrC family response regulator
LTDHSTPKNLIGKLPIFPTFVDSMALERPQSGSAAEKRFLESELAAAGGNIARLARKLGIARSTLRYRIFLHNISRQGPPD